jgi:hypothetical protein
MNQFKVKGIVPKLLPNYKEFRLKAENGSELEEFFKSENIDTKLSYSEEKPVIKVKGELALQCHEGDRVCLTIEIYPRKDGRRIRGVDIKIL